MRTNPKLPEFPIVRKRLAVRGVVQGVGFRPHVYQLAIRHGLTGFVGNDSAGVFIEVQGPVAAAAAFQAGLVTHLPPLARVSAVTAEDLTLREEASFVIVPSDPSAAGAGSVPPDVGTCAGCLRELFDPADRRCGYPFINCTHCGPRFTIIRGLPYDRPATTMSGFPMCRACEHEYHDPRDRRFHAQPVACPACGPHVWLEVAGVTTAERSEAISDAGTRIAAGAVLAVKGIGGFHLACDATHSGAVTRLRERKGRGGKPFAVMVRGVEQARRYAVVSDDEARLLSGPERPVVLLTRRPAPDPLADAVAPGCDTLGLMLPYSPLHHLLVTDRPLVMTSGNRSDEPIARTNAEALARLAGLADAFLLHDRDITTPCDDSVVRVFGRLEYPVRRSRGYAPLPVRLPQAGRPVLAVGGELKATLCVTTGDLAYLSQHIGDVASPETLEALDRTAEHLLDLFRVAPEVVVCDRHPGYLSADWAARFADRHGATLVRVQHHHAHVAALLVDSQWSGGAVLGVCFDGTGYGTDGAIWGGEFFLADEVGVRRVAHLQYVPLPGGDAAVRRPYRVALAQLWAAGVPWTSDLPCVAACPEVERRVLLRQLERNVACVPTSSAGRLFDAVAALLGVRQEVTYEAQAAIEMEAGAGGPVGEPYPFPLITADPLRLDPAPLIAALAADVRAGVPVAVSAGRFHATVAAAVLTVSRAVRDRTGTNAVGLTGGVFQNTRLLRLASDRLRADGFAVLVHRQVPANDGGLALGQAALAAGYLPNG
ncbi:carbamoyltransferase HypF [Frigoriglobus tundricola]|uniref:Carbamoyltransferase n=1 Tax=Frigoriglobus tundricola TaxID=2774151 RepID=A0A6M5YP12_9BACT|nr:carbamoyltransferase HypF [Frigoriglobus tundricola]QJW94971.1 Acylphosphate phosphohydrolase / [NiFe] hydrogenase metallocenter assembly protein HypF [Frigoriglobus tundricola]